MGHSAHVLCSVNNQLTHKKYQNAYIICTVIKWIPSCGEITFIFRDAFGAAHITVSFNFFKWIGSANE